jgi:hypothetical protein
VFVGINKVEVTAIIIIDTYSLITWTWRSNEIKYHQISSVLVTSNTQDSQSTDLTPQITWRDKV